MHQKIRQEHELNVPRDVVYATMTELDQAGLESRALGPFHLLYMVVWTQQVGGCFGCEYGQIIVTLN